MNLTNNIWTVINDFIDEKTYYYDSSKNCTREISKRDGLVRFYRDFIYDDNSRLSEFFQFSSPGSDGNWFTPDDAWSSKIVIDDIPPSETSAAMPWIPLLLLGE